MKRYKRKNRVMTNSFTRLDKVIFLCSSIMSSNFRYFDNYCLLFKRCWMINTV